MLTCKGSDGNTVGETFACCLPSETALNQCPKSCLLWQIQEIKVCYQISLLAALNCICAMKLLSSQLVLHKAAFQIQGGFKINFFFFLLGNVRNISMTHAKP